MKANVALTLSFTGIRLLHRAAGGWRFVGEVALDDPDLDGALAALRRTALELEPSGLRTKLVLPETQIRYLTIETAETAPEELHAAAMAALDGATPYAVSDLVFDLSPDGDQTHVAAVARETLAEAEAFAVEHRFAPISAVGVPDGEAFLGEPFFGPTNHAAGILGPGETVEPDGVAVVELGPQEWPNGPVVDVTDETPVAGDEQRVSPQDSDAPEEQAATAAPDESETAQTDTPDEDLVDPATRSVGFASRRRPGSTASPKLGGVTRRFVPAAVSAPEETDADEAEEPSQAPSEPEQVSVPDDDIPDPPPAVLAAFLSRRHADADATDPPATEPGRDAAKAPAAPTTKALPPQEEASVPSMTQAADSAGPLITPPRVPRPQSERQRMTVFGARRLEGDGAAVVGGKPRYLGLVLTAMLLLFLAGVAAWAAIFIDEGLARFFAPRAPQAPVTAEELAPEPGLEPESVPQAETESAAAPEEPAADETPVDTGAEPPTQPDGDLQTASLEPDLTPEGSVDADALAEPEPPKVFDPAEAAAQYAVTGIWTVPPEVPHAPGLVDVDDLYVTSIDPPSESFDAVALQPQSSYRPDQAPLAPANPAPPGTTFDFDERGLVIPTPDGSMSPDGIMIYSGPPAVVPPETPERAEEKPEDTDAALRPELTGFRPRARPTDLVENTERRQLGGPSRSELAGYRPRLRPETTKQAEEKDETPTAQAVASSERPSTRPGNFAQIVARAQERSRQAPTSSNEAPTQTAAVAPRTVAPSIPSRSSVTKEATVRNAINLRRINLMGVYGSPSNRRALVRLSNGRYKKVKVGDRIDGGRVSAIGDSELSYVKGSRSIVLKMPRT